MLFRRRPPRALTRHERRLTRWIIEHGSATVSAKGHLLAQLEHAAVVRHCACGCETVDFAIDGVAAPSAGLDVVGDFFFGDLGGVFVYTCANQLAGLEVWSVNGALIERLPSIRRLRDLTGRGARRSRSRSVGT